MGDSRAGNRPRQGTSVLALLGVIGPLYYIALTVVLGSLWAGYDPIRLTQSELGAVDSPYRLVMNVGGFMVLGLAILAFSAAYYLLLGRVPARSLATGLLVVAGVGTLAVGFFPCDPGCNDTTPTGHMHSLLSAPGAIGLPAAAMLSAMVFKRDQRFGTAWQVGSFWIGLVTLAAGPVIAADLMEGSSGILQRAAMWPALLWMAAVALKLRALSR
jgi:hypothetical membrane protein